jgi:hypothetical protein
MKLDKETSDVNIAIWITEGWQFIEQETTGKA